MKHLHSVKTSLTPDTRSTTNLRSLESAMQPRELDVIVRMIGLKEKQNLPWSRIAEHFPGRSKGSLEVHYCTKLKGRPDGSSGQTSNTQKRSATRSSSSKICRRASGLRATTSKSADSDVLSGRRYGPSRARRAVSRYSPV
jgi:hypothetical protein